MIALSQNGNGNHPGGFSDCIADAGCRVRHFSRALCARSGGSAASTTSTSGPSTRRVPQVSPLLRDLGSGPKACTTADRTVQLL